MNIDFLLRLQELMKTNPLETFLGVLGFCILFMLFLWGLAEFIILYKKEEK